MTLSLVALVAIGRFREVERIVGSVAGGVDRCKLKSKYTRGSTDGPLLLAFQRTAQARRPYQPSLRYVPCTSKTHGPGQKPRGDRRERRKARRRAPENTASRFLAAGVCTARWRHHSSFDFHWPPPVMSPVDYTPIPPPPPKADAGPPKLTAEEEVKYSKVYEHFTKEGYALPDDEKGALTEEEQFWLVRFPS